MNFAIQEHTLRRPGHTMAYLSCGPEDGTPIIFVHGWPELALSWRHQMPAMAALGFRAIAPDMRGYGRSTVHSRTEDYAVEHSVADLIALLDAVGAPGAVWVGHDWGAPVVWALAQHHADRCLGVANLCVPYLPQGFSPETIIPLSNRSLYPPDTLPAAQWDYQLFYREHFHEATQAFERNVRNTVRALFRAGTPDAVSKPARTAFVRAQGGWFGPGQGAPALPRDASVLSEQEEHAYVAALERNGFAGPDSWYMNGPANEAYALRAREHWQLQMPVLFLHAEYDVVCETLQSRLAEPMRAHCSDLTEAIVASGHWMAQERPVEVNAALVRWLAQRLPQSFAVRGH
ncbi:MAG: alpha/beta fold hydrolase [Burkholderiaceae bacterium]